MLIINNAMTVTVMAESERESRPESTASTNRLQWLRQRREALQEKLARKNNELKNLCIDEAELTGILPPEIPLDPGESPPIFRRRVGTSFAYPQNLINKLKTNQAAEEQALELERQVQTGIAKAAYAIFNDPLQGKAVRRKHRSVYQQSQRRLKELETRLNFIRQGYGRLHRRSNVEGTHTWQSSPSSVGEDDTALLTQTNVKHRSKKPRPPLDPGLDRLSNPKINSENTIKVSNIDQASVVGDWHSSKNSLKDNGWRTSETSLPGSKNPSTDGAIPHDLNDNSDMYILTDQCRARTYSHGNNSDDVDLRHMRHQQIVERGYRTISGGYTEEDPMIARRNNIWSREQKRQYEAYHYNQRQQPMVNTYKQPPKYHRSYHQEQLTPTESLDQQILSPTIQPRSRYTYYPPGQYTHINSEDNRRETQISRQEHEHIPERIMRRNNHDTMLGQRHEMGSNDNWMPDVEETWQHSERQQQHGDNRFGSIDRRKQRDSSSTSSLHRYQTGSQETVTPVPPRYPRQPVTDNKPKYLSNPPQNIRPERIEPPSTRTLLRTQSLGSVETWHSGSPTTCPSPVIATTITTMQPSTTAGSVHRVYSTEQNSRDNHSSYRDSGKEWYETSMDFSYPKPTLPPQPPKNLEIPAESGRLNTRRDGDINFDSSLSPTDKVTADGRTIVHAGKYQPYKEVTKPFEMSDFYKYSTKFRKKVESTGNTQGTTAIPHAQSNIDNKSNNNDIDPNCDTTLECRQQISNTHGPAVHRRVVNSVQTVPSSQPYIAAR